MASSKYTRTAKALTLLAIDEERDGFPGVVEEPKMNFRLVLPSLQGTVDQPYSEEEPHFHVPPDTTMDRREGCIISGSC